MSKIQFATNIPVELRLASLEGEVVESKFGGNQIKFAAHEGLFWVSEAVGSILIDQIRKKKIEAHVPVEICRREIPQGNGRKAIVWGIDPVGFVPGEQPDGTFAVPANPSAASRQPPAADLAQQLQASIDRAKARVFGPQPKNGAEGGKPPAPLAAPTTAQPSAGPNNHNNTNGNAAPPANGNGHHPTPADLAHSGWAAYIREHAQARIQIYVDLCKWAADTYGGSVSKNEVSAFLMNVLISGDKNGGAR